MADYLKEINDNVESFEIGKISYREAKAVNCNIFERISKEYVDAKPMLAIVAQLENCSLLMLKEAKLRRDLENKEKGQYPGDWVEIDPDKDLYEKAVEAYKKVCDDRTSVKDKDGNIIPFLSFVYPSELSSEVGRKYVHLRNSNGDIARYVIKTGEIIV